MHAVAPMLPSSSGRSHTWREWFQWKDTEASSMQPTMNTTIKLGVPDLVTNSYFPALAALGLGCF